MAPPKAWPPMARCAAGHSRVRTPAAATGSQSRPILATGTASTRAILEFSKAYAEQNERDYKPLRGGDQVRPEVTAETGL